MKAHRRLFLSFLPAVLLFGTPVRAAEITEWTCQLAAKESFEAEPFTLDGTRGESIDVAPGSWVKCAGDGFLRLKLSDSFPPLTLSAEDGFYPVPHRIKQAHLDVKNRMDSVQKAAARSRDGAAILAALASNPIAIRVVAPSGHAKARSASEAFSARLSGVEVVRIVQSEESADVVSTIYEGESGRLNVQLLDTGGSSLRSGSGNPYPVFVLERAEQASTVAAVLANWSLNRKLRAIAAGDNKLDGVTVEQILLSTPQGAYLDVEQLQEACGNGAQGDGRKYVGVRLVNRSDSRIFVHFLELVSDGSRNLHTIDKQPIVKPGAQACLNLVGREDAELTYLVFQTETPAPSLESIHGWGFPETVTSQPSARPVFGVTPVIVTPLASGGK